MRYLTGEELLILHAELINRTGGAHGVRDTGLLLSVVERPKMSFGGSQLYPSVFSKAAAYFESIAMHHVFTDGNKRTAFVAAARFLHLNGYELTMSNTEVEKFVLRAVREKVPLKSIAGWFKKHARKKK